MSNSVPGLNQIMKVSVPIMLSMLAQNIITITDLIFVGNYAAQLQDPSISEGLLGAVGIGAIYYYALFMVCFGFATGMQILVSRRNGEKNFEKIGGIIENGLFFLWGIAFILVFLSLSMTAGILNHLIESPQVVKYTKDFLQIRVFGLLFSSVSVAFRAFHVGTINTKSLTYSAIIAAVVNIILNYTLIFGRFGFPQMGIQGSATASVIAELFGASVFILYNVRKKIRDKYNLFRFQSVDLKTLQQILSLSIYVMLQYTLSVATWLAFFIVIEKSGKDHLDSSQLVRSIYSFLTIPNWALAAATSSFVSNAIGNGKYRYTLIIIAKLTIISLIISIGAASILLLFQNPILSVFGANTHLMEITQPSIRILIGAILIFSVSTIPFNGISGTGKTGVAMIIELLSLLFYSIGIYLLHLYFKENPSTYWFSEYIYWGGLALFSFFYLRSGRWRKGVNKI